MPELPRRAACHVNTGCNQKYRHTSLLGRVVGVGRNGWGQVQTRFEMVRGGVSTEHDLELGLDPNW